MTTSHLRKSIAQSCVRRGFLFIPFVLGCFALCQNAQAVVPAPDGGYAGNNTAEGTDALFSLRVGRDNTALGFQALYGNTSGFFNTASGTQALFNNYTGFSNTANGRAALYHNTSGHDNTASGINALFTNNEGDFNTAFGSNALLRNTTGFGNVAIGDDSLINNVSGSGNTAVGFGTGANIVNGVANTYIGDGVRGPADESNTIRIGRFAVWACFIEGIVGAPNFADTVKIDRATGQLGDQPSSARFKKDIDPMAKTSEAIFSLRPVTFRYKKDTTNTPQFGLIAEEVAKVNPALIGVDKEGKPYCVRYEQIDAMLLNEFLKEHKKVAEQQSNIDNQQASIAELKATVAQQQKGMEILTAQLKEQAAQIQKVSAQIEISRPAPQTVRNNH